MQGAIPISWDQAIATKRLSKPPHCVIWSPCSQFIAISLYSIPTIQILDAATLKLLKSFTTTHDHIKLFAFSSKSHLLTCLGDGLQVIISWDLQTGVQVGQVPMGEHWSSLSPHSITHSRCGTMFGVLYGSAYFATTIVTYSILSSAHIHEHSINGLLLGTIWTHGECLQFATLGSESLTIWEVEFSSKCPPTEVKSLLIPKKNPGPYMSFFLPNLSRLVFINQDSLFIWDTQYSKLLLDTVVRECGKMSFSSDGHFFACGASGPEIYLWKESPTGYILHKKPIPTGLKHPGFSNTCQPLLSPNGQTIIVPHGFTIQLLQATDSTTSSSVPSQPFPGVYHFILGFSLSSL